MITNCTTEPRKYCYCGSQTDFTRLNDGKGKKHGFTPIDTDYITEELATVSGVIRDDIHVREETVTTYIPADQLENVEAWEHITVEVLEEYEHEYLISAKPSP